jgi:hypothetical protein
VEAPAFGVDLDAAFGHQRPRDQRTLRHRPRAVALVAAEIGEARAERAAPGDRAAVVAGMAGEDGVAHLGQQLAHHRRIAAEAVAGEQQDVAGDVLDPAVRTREGDADDPVLGIAPELVDARLMNLQCARAQRRRIERADQRGAGALRHRVHAERAVARVDEALQQLEADAVLRPEPSSAGPIASVYAATRCGAARPCALARMSCAKRAGLSSSTPAARCTAVPAAGMKPEDNAVEPRERASRSSSTQSMPASRRVSAAVNRTRRRRRSRPAPRGCRRASAVHVGSSESSGGLRAVHSVVAVRTAWRRHQQPSCCTIRCSLSRITPSVGAGTARAACRSPVPSS